MSIWFPGMVQTIQVCILLSVLLIDFGLRYVPENPQNWGMPKKFFVAFQICLLCVSIYIGSAIYTPGEEEITEIFGVSTVVATLGLCLFVAGYGLGPSKF